jgi:hypothetical protein
MKTPPTQIRKFSVIFGSLICFLSISSRYHDAEPDTSGPQGRSEVGTALTPFSAHAFLGYTASTYD